MQEEPWRYKIGGGLAGPILSLLLLALFGGSTAWLYHAQNGAYLFGMMLTLAAAVVLLVAIYQTLFVKVRLGERGFYQQTRPGNGRYYSFEEITKAYVSAGRNLNGTKSGTCRFETYSGQTGQFLFLPADGEGVRWFLQCVRANGASDKTPAAREDSAEYQLDGKAYGKANMAAALALLVVFATLAVSLWRSGIPVVAFGGGVALTLGLVVLSVVRYFCFQVRIGTTGFYVQSTPFNGRYYDYRDIQHCEVQQSVYRHRAYRHHRNSTLYYYYFLFTPKGGKARRFQFEKTLHGHEINVLKARIQKG